MKAFSCLGRLLGLLILGILLLFAYLRFGQASVSYPSDGVRGIYLPGHLLEEEQSLLSSIQWMKENNINSVVIDLKDDQGLVHLADTKDPGPYLRHTISGSSALEEAVKVFKKHRIYPIARLVTFKDSTLPYLYPALAFIDQASGEVWTDAGGSAYLDPSQAEVQAYIEAIIQEAKKIGFSEVQLDYVRLPEGFNTILDELMDLSEDLIDGPSRVHVITQFLAGIHRKTQELHLTLSADLFGYVTLAGAAEDVESIGQNFYQMCQHLDVVSAMIYPSHWGEGFAGFLYPDLMPYEIIDHYLYEEKLVCDQMEQPPISRPWLQDFTASYLPEGTYQLYGLEEVQAQIDAVRDNGGKEFLLWNAEGIYQDGLK